MKGAPTPIQTDFFKWRQNPDYDPGNYILTDNGKAIVFPLKEGTSPVVITSQGSNLVALNPDGAPSAWGEETAQVIEDPSDDYTWPRTWVFNYRGVALNVTEQYDGDSPVLEPYFDQYYQP